MNLYTHRRYKISFDSSKTYVGTQPPDVDIPIFYNDAMLSNVDKIQMVTLKITWTNPNPLMPAIWAVQSFTLVRANNSTETTTTNPIHIVPSGDITISATNLIFITQAISIEEEEIFEILCMKNDAEQERVNKRTYLSLLRVMTGTLRESSSVTNPTITFEWEPVDQPLFVNMGSTPNFNYVYIPIFGRFYFVDNPVYMANNLWVMNLSCDVLMTYRSEILTNSAEIERQEFDYNEELIDDQRMVENGYDFTIVESAIDPDTIFNVTTDDAHYPNFGIVLGVYN